MEIVENDWSGDGQGDAAREGEMEGDGDTARNTDSGLCPRSGRSSVFSEELMFPNQVCRE